MTGGRVILTVVLLGTLVGCEGRRGNFSQYPGFSEYFAAHPPTNRAATPDERELLHRHCPRLALPAGHAGPIDFYADYIAHGRLYDGRGRLLAERVTPAVLNAHKEDPGAVFIHRPGTRPTMPTLYGRVDRETVTFPTDAGNVAERFSFLTYHAVFPVSGLPAGLPLWQSIPLGLLASLDDWHQLDHYTAAMLALDDALVPVAITLQQHNHLRTYLLGRDLPLAPDGRVRLDVAIRSNELYPHATGRTRRRAVAMPTPRAMRFLLSGTEPPLRAADDITDGVAEADPVLRFLPTDDAFYTFQGYLGERRWLPGRDGPPGADYNTLPRLKPRALQMLAFYWREGDAEDLARFDRSMANGGGLVAFARAQAQVFYHRWRKTRSSTAPGRPPAAAPGCSRKLAAPAAPHRMK